MPIDPLAEFGHFAAGLLTAILLLAASLAAAVQLSAHLLPRARFTLRAIATAICWQVMVTVAFHALAAAQAFSRPAAIVLSIAGLALARRFWPAVRRFGSEARRHVVAASRVLLRSQWSLVIAPGALLIALLLVRVLFLPPLGADAVTYRAVKAALWVQAQGGQPLNLPGGWSMYQSYFGGAEVPRAWLLLSFGDDFALLWVDVVEWVLLALVVFALARELGGGLVRAVHIAVFVALTPTVVRLVGSAYSDLAVGWSLTAAVLFGVRAVRTRSDRSVVVAIAAAGLAAGIKTFAIPAAVACVLVVSFFAVARRGRRAFVQCVAGVLVVGATCGPWLVRNIELTGYPLSPLSVTILGHKLGVANDAMREYLALEYQHSPGSLAEYLALRRVFAVLPATEALGVQALIPLLLLPFTLASLVRRDRAIAAIVLVAVASSIASYYAPDFTIVRRNWAPSTSRFLIALIAVSSAAMAALPDGPHTRRLISVLQASSVINLGLLLGYVFIGTGAAVWKGAAFILLPGVAAWWLLRARGYPFLTRVACGVLVLAGVYFTRAAFRYELVDRSVALHVAPTYWLPAAKALDQLPGHRIAVTSGPFVPAHNQTLYYFLGRRFQNQLTYVAPGEPTASVDWVERVVGADVDYVMSLAPASIELDWMASRPDRFAYVVGDSDNWGLFRVVKR